MATQEIDESSVVVVDVCEKVEVTFVENAHDVVASPSSQYPFRYVMFNEMSVKMRTFGVRRCHGHGVSYGEANVGD